MILNKLFFMFSLFFKNHRQFKYYLDFYLDKTISEKKSSNICRKNDIDYKKMNINRYNVETYDKSNQYTHPDIICWNKKTFLILTPYPYGIETYENPSLYEIDDSFGATSIVNNPIATQKIVKRKYHLSDPFLYSDSNSLFLFYRNNYFENQKECVSIEYRTLDKNLLMGSVKELIKGHEDFLSPIFYKKGDMFFFQYMNKNDKETVMVERCFSNELIEIEKNSVSISGFPDGYHVWHFGIDHDTQKIIRGLLLLRNLEDNFILCEGMFDSNKHTWFFTKKIEIPTELEKTIDHVYKSCYIPNTDKILLSYRDKKHRYYSSITESK